MSEKTRHLYAFGPFHLDAKERLLILDGKPVPLAHKAFEALLMLVENAGRLVDKDDLMRRLWPDTFVEEANVAKHVSLLRKVLSEATNGREYIETIPKRGYRFVVDVTEVVSTALEKDRETRYQSASDMRADLQRLKRDSELTQSPATTTTAETGRGVRGVVGNRWKVLVPGALAVAALAVGAYFYFHRVPVLTNKDLIVLADFTDTTGDAVFDDTLKQALAIQLEQSPFLTLVSEQRIQQTLRQMRQPPDARLTPEIARELCQRTTSAAVLNGSIANLGCSWHQSAELPHWRNAGAGAVDGQRQRTSIESDR